MLHHTYINVEVVFDCSHSSSTVSVSHTTVRIEWDVWGIIRNARRVVPIVVEDLCGRDAVGGVGEEVADVNAEAQGRGGVVLMKGS